jgi:hypothetical protein
MNSSTQAQQFAAAYAANMATEMMRTIKRVRQAATAIMVIAMVVSYTHQAHYLASIGTAVLGAWAIPGALDALTFLCVKVLGTPGMAQPARTMALRVLVFPVLASGAINFLGPGQIVTKCVFVLAVLMIPAAELVASRIKPDFAAMDAMERDITPAGPARKLDPQVAAERAAKARATREANKLAKLSPAEKAARTRARRAVAPVSPGRVPLSELNAEMAR